MQNQGAVFHPSGLGLEPHWRAFGYQAVTLTVDFPLDSSQCVLAARNNQYQANHENAETERRNAQDGDRLPAAHFPGPHGTKYVADSLENQGSSDPGGGWAHALVPSRRVDSEDRETATLSEGHWQYPHRDVARTRVRRSRATVTRFVYSHADELVGSGSMPAKRM